MSIRRAKSESGFTTTESLVTVMVLALLFFGGVFAAGWIGDSTAEKAAPATIERMASQIDEEAEGLSEDTLLKSVYTKRMGLDNNSTMDVSFNDPETKVLTAKRSIPASADYSSKVTGTVGDYTITYAGQDVEFTYDSTTGEITKTDRN